MAASSLEALGQRLQTIVNSTGSHDKKLTTTEHLEDDNSGGKLICSKCAAVYATARGLARHYRSEHIDRSDRPIACSYEGCERRFRTEQLCREHKRSTHRFPCQSPGCQRDFANGALLAQHEDEHTRRDSNFQTRTCPHPSCGQIFPDQATLFAHYDGLHPLSVFSPGKKLPYKCPFCTKKYAMERYMAGHQRRDHSTNEGVADEKYESQAALIRESHDSMARKASRVSIEDLSPSYPGARNGTEPYIKRENTSVTVLKHTIYMHDEFDLTSPQSQQPREHAPQNRSEKMAIGYLLQPHASAHTSDEDMEDHDDDPESLALDDWELPKKTANSTRRTSDSFSSDAFDQRVVGWVLTLLNMDHWLTVSEVLEIWDAFLTPAQRVVILEQLHHIDIGEDDSVILSALHGSVLCEVIHAWARFKLLTLQLPNELRQHTKSAKGTTWAVLKYCAELESLIKEGRLTASTLGLVWPVSLREAPLDEHTFNLDAHFVVLLAALEARVKCRMVHPDWMQFTNELILKEMAQYLQDLRTEVEATRSMNLRTIDWFGKMNLL